MVYNVWLNADKLIKNHFPYKNTLKSCVTAAGDRYLRNAMSDFDQAFSYFRPYYISNLIVKYLKLYIQTSYSAL